MWASLRSDLREFVSSVADDSKVLQTRIVEAENTVLHKASFGESPANSDEKLLISEEGDLDTWAVDEADRRMCLIDTYTQDLFSVSFNQKTSGESLETPDIQDSQVNDEEDEEASQFLSSFDIESKTDEIASILQSNAIVQQHFESLVPVVISYEQFWQRYFFRCDPERIQRQWDAEEERIRQERRQLIERGVSSVKNIFGGALKALHTTVSRSGESTAKSDTTSKYKDPSRSANIYEKYQARVEEEKRALMEGRASVNDHAADSGPAFSFFGSSRPPFVLNTAESGDDDVGRYSDPNKDTSQGGEEEEEEDIGWGSEDDEDDDVDDDITEGNSTHDNSEPLNSGVNPSSDQAKALSSTESQSSNDEIKRLGAVLLEKEKEITALKSSLENSRNESAKNAEYEDLIQSQSREVEILQQGHQVQRDEIQRMKLDLHESISSKIHETQLYEAASRELEDAKVLISQLKTDLQHSIDVAHNEGRTTDALTAENSNLKIEIEKLHQMKVEADNQIALLMTAVNELKSKGIEAQNRILELETELEKKNGELQRLSIDLAAKAASDPLNIDVDKSPPESNASSIISLASSGVKVPSPKSQEASVIDEDDWGEAWGDGDD